MPAHSIEQAVRYAETDRMGVVHHSTYLIWYEVGRTSLLEAAGYPYHELEASGTLFPVIEYSCRLVSAADYGDRVRIDTTIHRLRSRMVEFAYRLYVRDSLIATGTSRHVAVDRNHVPRRMPQAVVDALEQYVEA